MVNVAGCEGHGASQNRSLILYAQAISFWTTLHENVDRIPILINGTPELLPFPFNGDEHLVDVPPVSRAALSCLKRMRIGKSKLPAPWANRFVGNHAAMVGHQCFDLSDTEVEPMVQPDGVTDDLREKIKTAVTGRVWYVLHQSVKPRST